MELMGRKLTAAEALEGKFSGEGLAAMAGEEASMELELARSLETHLDSGSAQRAWEKLATTVATVKRQPTASAEKPVVAGKQVKAQRRQVSGLARLKALVQSRR